MFNVSSFWSYIFNFDIWSFIPKEVIESYFKG